MVFLSQNGTFDEAPLTRKKKKIPTSRGYAAPPFHFCVFPLYITRNLPITTHPAVSVPLCPFGPRITEKNIAKETLGRSMSDSIQACAPTPDRNSRPNNEESNIIGCTHFARNHTNRKKIIGCTHFAKNHSGCQSTYSRGAGARGPAIERRGLERPALLHVLVFPIGRPEEKGSSFPSCTFEQTVSTTYVRKRGSDNTPGAAAATVLPAVY